MKAGKTEVPPNWYVRDDKGNRYGPVPLATLQAWARDGRLGATTELSQDQQNWQLAARLAELELEWLAELAPGRFHGPAHRQALEELMHDGVLAVDVTLFRRQPLTATESSEDAQRVAAMAVEQECLRQTLTALEERALAAEARDAAARAQLADGQAAALVVQAELRRLETELESVTHDLAQAEAAQVQLQSEMTTAQDAHAAALQALHSELAAQQSQSASDLASLEMQLETAQQQADQERAQRRQTDAIAAGLLERALAAEEQLQLAQRRITELRSAAARRDTEVEVVAVEVLPRETAAAAAATAAPKSAPAPRTTPPPRGRNAGNGELSRLMELERQVQLELAQLGAQKRPFFGK